MSMIADDLLRGVKNTITFVDSISTLDDTALLKKIDDAVKTYIVPMVDASNGEFFVTDYTTPVVAGQTEYSIPYRAIGRTVRDLLIVDSSGNKQSSPYIAPEDAHLYKDTALDYGHYFRGDKVVLVPDIPTTYSSGESLNIPYKLRPSKLVKLDQAAKVSSVSSPDVTVEAIGDIATGSVVDFIEGKSGRSILGMDKTVSNVSGTTITFAAADIPSALAQGDYISIQGTSPVVTMIPDDFQPYLEKVAARLVLLAIDDEVGMQKLEKLMNEEKKNLSMLIEPRNDGEPKVILNRNGLARGSKFSQTRWIIGGV